ncbi:MAG: bifunctional (p)ppGpp synthetase/guanosine-3',5'-bis(diphosphate) 3'-pyrophosphohydrolase [Deltaproteobacteria bacterium]|nr:bifunctional (p)ppGpp synthetase/guanosine-3',5'-bis(diphosphate) 3'-pyrophosphohydrolase [Deltaproteobacteria bacterium]MBW1923523.1 bifunctional (p)ppGpp synthetase/guanosine-3',5'-bis(diphosphate) 3'-pyrophosphohydrolase [Deltaproteobacteria bacterium]MBW1950242.1 bifunctional (p)ppGpp synthetase/guanosine-3',5'-bis(diphosphate) 3'-pyrophosphohydrolase [Deltaproteobacteria bacterium]MBW2008712.1 bifunctional (p)ppGpp synthetase/guanosine-3',5'-bis(diphosphate) 3'-pyrophosphohydrolase [Delt
MGNLVEKALETAAIAHRDQVRKGTNIPYITHPCAVALILAAAGCGEEVVAAGLLHDTVEDTPMSLEEIREGFGEGVARIVAANTEPPKSLPWEERKEHTIASLASLPLDARLVMCADKLHNLRTIAAEHRELGEKVWERFKRGRKEQEWYYRGLARGLCHRPDLGDYAPLFRKFEEEVDALFSAEPEVAPG